MASKKRAKPSGADGTVVAANKKASHDYHFIEKFEAGIELRGTEVKSIRLGKINLRDAYCRVEKGDLILHGCDIQPYEMASWEQHAAKRPRRLLLHRKEILRIDTAIAQQGLTVVATSAYWKNSRVKIEIAIARGKNVRDQRDDIKKRVEIREAQREMAQFNKSRA